MTRTPNDIKKGLAACNENQYGKHVGCPYVGEMFCIRNVCGDALALIQQLEAERDAAVEDLESYATLKCFACKHYEVVLTEVPCNECKIMGKGNSDMFEWRGAQKEDICNDCETR